jgi:hypothetical protein
MRNTWLAVAAGAACVALAAGAQDAKRDEAKKREEGVAVRGVHPPKHDMTQIDAVPEACWAEVRTQHVYFAHGPVGGDVLKGVNAILEERPEIAWKIVPYGETGDAAAPTAGGGAKNATPPTKEGERSTSTVFAAPSIVEGPAGADGDPKAKIDRFVSRLRSKEGAQVEVATLLLSTGDIVRGTDVEALARHYFDAMKSLSGERPTLRVLHCTVPLDFPDSGMRAKLRKMTGRGFDHANALRGRFNDLLRAEYGRDRIIDIAHAMSERADGTHCTVRVGAVRWSALAPEHADDDGNLNVEGRCALGCEFMLSLVRPCEAARATK